MSKKFLSLRTRDIQQYLSVEQKQSFLEIVTTIRQAREKTSQPAEVLFTLNARDKFAQNALEAYVQAIQSDVANQLNEGSMAAMNAAQAARDEGLMIGPQKLPSI
jgi:hypothetical protein